MIAHIRKILVLLAWKKAKTTRLCARIMRLYAQVTKKMLYVARKRIFNNTTLNCTKFKKDTHAKVGRAHRKVILSQ